VARERDRAHDDDHELANELASTSDTELEYLRRVYRGEVTTALRKALFSLEVRQQNVLRHYFLDRLRIDQIARIHVVHRATAARWLEAAKAQLIRRARRALETQLDVGTGGFDSVVRLLQSQMHVSLQRIFRGSR